MDRREFVAAGAAFLGLAAGAQGQAQAQAQQPIRIGIIGAGSRGQELLSQALHLPGTTVTAVCDVYPPRFEQVARLAGKPFFRTDSYQELLAHKDLDAVLVASPLAWHGTHTTAAIESGHPVYAEKALGFTVADCQRIRAAALRQKGIFQVGHQYRYAPWIQESLRRIAAGRIGVPTHVYAYWHRNNNWRRPVPAEDPGGRLEHLINWRLYRESSGGLVTELGSHHIDIANWVFGEQPESVLGTTGITRYHDGRTTGDNVQAIFKYSGGRRLVFSSLTDNAKSGNELWIYGTEGSVQITIEDATFYYEKGKEPGAVKVEASALKRGVETSSSYATAGEMPYRGPGERVVTGEYEDPTLTALRSFVGAVRNVSPVAADVKVGFASAIACAVAHDAVFEERLVKIPAAEAVV
jgi:predicted dehydrogenase